MALLLREETPAPGPPAAPHEPDADLDNDHNPDPGLTQYMDSLVNTVTEIADKGPQRSDVWPGLLAAASYNGNSVMMPLFARHADKTAPYFLAAARGSIPGGGRADALIGLAKIVSYERDPATKHHLSSANVQLLDQTIRDMLSDANVLVKMQALTAVGIIGGVDDLNLLDKIASVDPYYDSEHDFYPYRVSARLAAENIRRRLATPKNANQ